MDILQKKGKRKRGQNIFLYRNYFLDITDNKIEKFDDTSNIAKNIYI